MTRVVNDMLLALDTNTSSMFVLLDLSAAFDTIDHSILLHWGTALRRLQSYLTDRTQFVLYEGSESKHCKLRFGLLWQVESCPELVSTATQMTPSSSFV